MDTNLIAFTETKPNISWGDYTNGYSDANEETDNPCRSKRGIVTLAGIGVGDGAVPTGVILFPGNLGYMAFLEQGRIINTTEALLTPAQWQALNPNSIKAVAHDGHCYFFYDNGSEQAGYILDVNSQGFGLVKLGFYPSAAFVDPVTDILYFVPTGTSTLSSWDTANTLLAYLWRSKEWTITRRTAFRFVRVRADDYTNLTMKLYADGTLYATIAITSKMMVPIPNPVAAEETFWIEFSGTSRVKRWELSESIEELTRDV
jgi:hypothetical protein